MNQSLWQYSTVHNSACKVIEEQTLWGQTVCRVWLPNQDAVVRVPRSALRPLSADLRPEIEAGRIAYVAAAAKVAEVLEGATSATEGHVLLAPMESNVIPLPHQIHALSRAISGDLSASNGQAGRVRYLLADEVGLGKTIEAGLVMRELKLRGLVRRTLVVSPKGIATQWVAEMQTHFNEQFQLVLGDDIGTLQRLAPQFGKSADHRNSVWSMFDQVIVSLDSVKPMDKRRGWTAERVAEYNRSRFEDLITAGWDLVIVDEAHRLGGSTDQVARYKLGKGLAEAAPYVLLLSATPHQGKTDAFHRLMNLLDDDAFPDMDSVSRDRVAPYVIRTEKRKAIDADGKPLFKPRRTQMAPVAWESRHQLQQLLYEAVTDYVREGYNQALREKKRHIGFLMILMQRLVVSSTRAIRTTLERRLAALKEGEQQASLRLAELENGAEGSESSDDEMAELYDMDGQELLDELLKSHLSALQSEGSHVETLLDAAVRCEQAGPDAKAEALIEWIYELQAEENEPDLKVLIFTEFVPTQQMLKEFLEARGISVVTLNGSMDMEERKQAQDAFRKSHRVLVSTDAGGEGLNLQFAHVIINYDIPWNPMRLEQRIGRVDRIGQAHAVRAVNFVFEGSVEHRVREVLEQKLAVIFEEFGIDKTGDVLDSAQAGHMFDEMYVEAILNPEKVEESVESVVARLQEQARDARTTASVLGATEDLEPGEAQRLLTHPLPHWVERMTVSYLKAHGGQAERRSQSWNLTWPDGETYENVVFTGKEAERLPAARHLTLEEPKVRGLAMRLPRFAPGQPVPIVSIPGISEEVQGVWSLWRIAIATMEWNRRRIMPLFLADNGMVYMPTARHVWDQLLAASTQVRAILDNAVSQAAFEKLQSAAEEHGKPIYEALLQEHRGRIAREREKADYAFAARRKTVERIGLPQVRNYRLSLLSQEERSFQEQLDQKAHAYPEMVPLLVIRVEGGGHE